MNQEDIPQVDNSQAIVALSALLARPALKQAFGKPYEGYRNADANNPTEMPAGPAIPAYTRAMEERIREFNPEYSADNALKIFGSTSQRLNELGLNEHSKKASNTYFPPKTRLTDVENVIAINPYHDRAALAHELGHTVTQRTALGSLMHKAKTQMRKPNIKQATELATVLVPGIASALTPGSNDVATALALAYAINAPTLLDEAFASGEGLGIMKRAGSPATLGQRGRLAGAFLSYLLQPTVSALAANAAGNFLDENV
tara:strand:- start:629 stop:1405 length:777 start_codon:yes stop_codon:yes gene_type:complete